MTQRTKLELPINQATELTLLYDEPISGKSQYGDYFMYAVAVGDEEYNYFASAEVTCPKIVYQYKSDYLQSWIAI